MNSILQYKHNIYSQNGEDGIIEEIFKRLQIQKGRFVEFGAWDGKHLSNSYKLFEEGWSGIFIEGDISKYKDLVYNFGRYDRVDCMNRFVGFDSDNSLDTIIDQSKFKDQEFDFISIDVDGLDYFIFEKMEKYLPKVICIEVSSGHTPDFSTILQISIAQNNIGQSIQVMTNKGYEKGYFPLCYSGNLFLVKNEYKHFFFTKSVVEIYFDFLYHIIGPNRDLMQYLWDLYCKQEGRTERLYNTFGYVFPENSYLISFLRTKLSIS